MFMSCFIYPLVVLDYHDAIFLTFSCYIIFGNIALEDFLFVFTNEALFYYKISLFN